MNRLQMFSNKNKTYEHEDKLLVFNDWSFQTTGYIPIGVYNILTYSVY